MSIFKKTNKDDGEQQPINEKNSKIKKEKPVKQKSEKKGKLDKQSKKLKPSQDPLVSLDFGTGDIKGIYGKVQGKKIKINKLFSTPVVGNWYKNGSVENSAEGQKALNALFQENKIGKKKVVCTIEGTNIVKREIIVPLLQKEDLDSMLKYEMGQYLPIDPAEYVMQYVERERLVEDGKEKIKLLVVMMPKTIVQGLQQFFSDADVTPYALDVHFNSMCKLIGFNGGKINNDSVVNSTIAIINIGNTTTDILVLKNGQYQFNVLLEFGFSVLRDTVANEIGLTGKVLFKKTDELLLKMFDEFNNSQPEEYQLTSDLYENINRYVISSLARKTEGFISDVDRSLKYYTMQDQDSQINKIYIYGGGASKFNLPQLMERELGIKTDTLRFMECIDYLGNDDLSPYWNAIGGLIRI